MFQKRIYLFTLIISCWLATPLPAQNTTTIVGKVYESATNMPIEFATVALINSNSKTSITGTTTLQDGSFSLDTSASNFYIEVSFIGYETKTITTFNQVDGFINLQTVYIEQVLTGLEEVIVRAETSQTEFKLDKRVFNVGKDLSSTGASVFEVLNNVPSVNVTIEGDIQLRGSQGVQVLINGKPSVLASDDGNALGTITADMIESIEVITNPSAKYDAQGTAGIINIIIKKSEKRGLNGSATLNVGVPSSNSFGLSVNKRTEKFNLFSQLGFGLRTFPDKRKSINTDRLTNTTISSTGESEFDEKFGNILIGTDYHLNERNIFTLSGSVAYEVEDQWAKTDFDVMDTSHSITDQWLRVEQTEATNPKIRYELQYSSDFKRHEDQQLLFSALGSYFRKDQSSVFENTTILGDLPDEEQESRTDYKLEEYTFKLDYTHPFLEYYTMETGAQYAINKVSNDFSVLDYIDNEWVNNPNLTNIFNLDQYIMAFYTTAAFEGETWGIKLGLRVENTQINTLLETTAESGEQDYTNVFPSAHTSYTVSDKLSFQLGYSRRINRPRLRQLNPFSNIRNNFSISEGNPELQPEFTDAFELTSIHKLEKASLNFSLYYRHTTDAIERISVFEDNVSISRPENVGNNSTTGLEINGKYSPSKWLTLNGDVNFNYFDRKGVYEAVSFDFKGNRWSTSITSKFKLPAQFDLEFSGDYISDFQTLQQEISDNFFVDMGVRKKIGSGKLILNLSIRDLFASRKDQATTSQPDFYLYTSRQRGRFITLGISYGFGKGEAMQFSGQRR